MTICSYAKINLHLAVKGKRADGFHDIETLYQEIDFGDQIEFALKAEGISLSSDRTELPLTDDNLVYQAAKALQAETNTQQGCHIHIIKRIPMGAGLGGGSSNAATALRVLNRLWHASLAPQELQLIASNLGSDVSFFIKGGAAWGRGRGEQLTPLSTPSDYYGVLVMPDLHISTSWSYRNSKFSLTKKEKNITLSNVSDALNRPNEWKNLFFNDLENVALNHYPVLKVIIQNMYLMGAFYARMTGSGSTLFGLFHYKKEASQAARHLSHHGQTVVFQPLDRQKRDNFV